MNRTRLAVATLICLVGLWSNAARAEVVIKLGTLAPEGSTWHNALKDIAARWDEISDHKVKVKIYAGGVAGDEGDMVRKMRVGQLSAAAISAVGLHDITPEPQILASPMLIQSYEELDAVMAAVGKDMEKALLDKGFVVISWADAGFVYFFSKKPAATPADMAALPLFSWAGDPKAVEAWKAGGFHPVVISSTDMIPSLQTGMIQAFTNSALVALALGWYNYAPNMTNVRWGILPGAVLVSKESWDKIQPDMQSKLLEAAHQIGESLKVTLHKQGDDAVKTMKEHGLNVVEVNDAQLAEWNKAAKASWPTLSASAPATFDQVQKLVTEYRKSHPAK
jgi:TRAP-type C4-dicarboxylate transport system substrate-binding protein